MESSAFKRYGQPVLIITLFLVVMVLTGFVTGVLNSIWELIISLPLLEGLEIPPGSAFKLLLSIPFMAGTLAVYIYPGRKVGGLSWKTSVSDTPASGDARILLLLSVFFLIPVGAQGAAAILETLSFRAYPNYELYETLLGMFRPTGHWLDVAGALITVGLIGPFCEEMVFRGFMLRGLLKSGTNLHLAVIYQGFLFGLVHGNPYQFSYAWPLGILLGYMAVYSRFGWATIWVHCVTNLFAMFAMYGFLPFLPAEAEPGQFLPFWFMAAGCLMMAAGVYLYFANVNSVGPTTAIRSVLESSRSTGAVDASESSHTRQPPLADLKTMSQDSLPSKTVHTEPKNFPETGTAHKENHSDPGRFPETGTAQKETNPESFPEDSR